MTDREILLERARALAQPKAPPLQLEAASWAVAATAGGERFLFPLSHVTATARLGAVDRVPFAPEYVLGLVQESGTLLAVIDLARVLRTVRPGEPRYRLTLAAAGAQCAIAVDAIEGFVRVDAAGLKAAPEHLPESLRGIVLGTDPEGQAVLEATGLLRAVGVVKSA